MRQEFRPSADVAGEVEDAVADEAARLGAGQRALPAGRAHVLLPAATWGEKSGTVTNSERRISRQRRFLPVPAEARSDWWIVTEVARRMGFVDAFDYDSPAAIFREITVLPAPGPPVRTTRLARAGWGIGRFYTRGNHLVRVTRIPSDLRASSF